MRGMMILPNGKMISGEAPKNMREANRYAKMKMSKNIESKKNLMRENKHQEILSEEVVETFNK